MNKDDSISKELDNIIDEGNPVATYDISEENDKYSEILPINFPMGHLTGLGVDETGRVIAFHRANRILTNTSFDKNNIFNQTLKEIKHNTIYVIDPESGDVVESYGSNKFLMPHGLSTDKNNNVWVTDIGTHQVHKLDKNYNIVMSLGEKRIPGNDKKHFCQPTDVAVSLNGDIFVADGYCNSRIVKFNKYGKYVTEFGSITKNINKPLPGEFFIIHSITLIENMDLLCGADLGNKRIQCFSAGLNEGKRAEIPTGMFLNEASNIGNVLAIREKNNYLVGSTGDDFKNGVESQLFIMDMKSRHVKTFLKGVPGIHSLAVSDDGVIFGGQLESKEDSKIPLSLIVFNKTSSDNVSSNITEKIHLDKDDILKVSNDDVMDPYYFGYSSPYNSFRHGNRPSNNFYYNQNLPYYFPYYNNYGRPSINMIQRNNLMNPMYGSNMGSKIGYNQYPYYNYNEGYPNNYFYNNNDNYKTMNNIRNVPTDENYNSYDSNRTPYNSRNNNNDDKDDNIIKPKKTQTFRSMLASRGNLDLDLNYDEDYETGKVTDTSSTINAPLTSLLHGVPLVKTKKPKPEKGVMMSNSGYSYAAYIERQANMYPIMMYTLIKCVPCQRAKHLLAVQYSDVRSHFLELAGDEDWQRQLQVDLQHITGALTFPYIFLCGNYIGGASDLFQLHQQGQLRRIVNACNPKI
uniref:peptidylamidoglycolate lyase n=1 Tax=Parastrongyloides trichosuri TaxID=131310 RepID=A0A0N4ZPJ5_PARTI